jgi:hypothetical protein
LVYILGKLFHDVIDYVVSSTSRISRLAMKKLVAVARSSTKHGKNKQKQQPQHQAVKEPERLPEQKSLSQQTILTQHPSSSPPLRPHTVNSREEDKDISSGDYSAGRSDTDRIYVGPSEGDSSNLDSLGTGLPSVSPSQSRAPSSNVARFRHSIHGFPLSKDDSRESQHRAQSRYSLSFDTEGSVDESSYDRERIGNAGRGFGNLMNDEGGKGMQALYLFGRRERESKHCC